MKRRETKGNEARASERCRCLLHEVGPTGIRSGENEERKRNETTRKRERRSETQSVVLEAAWAAKTAFL